MLAGRIVERLLAMKRKPATGWTLEDIASLCGTLDISCSLPGPGRAHCVISHKEIDGLLTLPVGRPLKAIYILLFVELADAVIDCR